MNLLSLLKPEYKANLTDKMLEYPKTKESIFKALTEKNYVIDLTIAEASDITQYLASKNFSNIYEMFNEKTIEL